MDVTGERDETTMAPHSVNRRGLIGLGTGALAVAAGIGATQRALAQAPLQGSASPLPPTKAVIVERAPGGILMVGIDRPETQNRIDAPMFLAIGKAYYELEHDDELRVAVLHAKGPHFVPGLDVQAWTAALQAGQLPPKDPEFLAPVNHLPPFRTKPLVVAVHGQTKTIGHELMLAGDVRVAATDTAFAQNEVFAGIFPAGGATVRFPREAGWANAMRYMLTGEEWDANEAYRLGLVQAVAPPGQQLDRAMGFAKKIAAAAPLGVRATLVTARQALGNEDAAFAALASTAAKIRASIDYQEFRKAAQEKRAPVYHGH